MSTTGGPVLLLWEAGPPSRDLPSKRPGSPVTGRRLVSCISPIKSSPRVLTEVQVKHRDTTVTQGTLIDSGADASLMDWALVHKLNLRTELLSQPIEASALNGSPLFRVTLKTQKVLVKIDDHESNMSFHVFSTP